MGDFDSKPVDVQNLGDEDVEHNSARSRFLYAAEDPLPLGHYNLEVSLIQASLDEFQSSLRTNCSPDHSYQGRSLLWAQAMVKGIATFIYESEYPVRSLTDRHFDVAGREFLLIGRGSDVAKISVSVGKKVTGIKIERPDNSAQFYPAPYIDDVPTAQYLPREEHRVNNRLAVGLTRVLNDNMRIQLIAFRALVTKTLKDAAPAVKGDLSPSAAMNKMIVRHGIASSVTTLTTDPHKFPGVGIMENLSRRLNFVANNMPLVSRAHERDPFVEYLALGLLAAEAAGRDSAEVIKAARKLYQALRVTDSLQEDVLPVAAPASTSASAIPQPR